MPGPTLFQCIPSYKPAATARLIKSLLALDCKILLDLEDSIQDMQHPALTPLLKQQARSSFEEIASYFPGEKFSLRINSVRSKQFMYDKILLKKFSDNVESVFIPKVESARDIALFYSEISKKPRLNLIIETRKGIDNLDEILSSDFAGCIDFVFFGNYDFHLDTGLYPIEEQDSPAYWKIADQLISKIEKGKIKFGNSPYAVIGDKHTLNFSLLQLRQLCKNDFALMSLHKSQTLHFRNLLSHRHVMPAIMESYQKKTFSPATFARHRQKGRSFSYTNNRIITPQEYLLAQRRQDG